MRPQSPKSYYRIMAGRKSVHAADCYQNGNIGADWRIAEELVEEGHSVRGIIPLKMI